MSAARQRVEDLPAVQAVTSPGLGVRGDVDGTTALVGRRQLHTTEQQLPAILEQVMLDPMFAGAATAFSSVFVVTNSLRRRRFRPLSRT